MPEYRAVTAPSFHLVLASAAVARDGLFDLVGRVFDHLSAGADASAMTMPLAWPTEMAVDTLCWNKHPFDRDHRWLVLGQQIADLTLELGKSRRNIPVGRVRDDSGRHRTRRSTGGFDTPVAAAREAGIDPENEHTYDLSDRIGERVDDAGASVPMHRAKGPCPTHPKHGRCRCGHGARRRDPPRSTGRCHRRSEPAVVSLREVTKMFSGVEALKGLNINVPRGHITVLLGPNGAGKTTAIRTITGALPSDGGVVRTFGLDPVADGETVRTRCGVVSAKPALYDRLSGWDNLDYSAALYGVADNRSDHIRESAERFQISDALDQLVGGYSTGMKTRLALAEHSCTNPNCCCSTSRRRGWTLSLRTRFWRSFASSPADDTTVVMCTHLLVEAEGLADQIVMLDDGVNLLEGSQRELIRRYWPKTIARFDAEDRSTLDILASLPAVVSYERDGAATVELQNDEAIADCVQHLVGAGVRLTLVEPHVPSLEELYFRVRREHRELHGGPAPAMTERREMTALNWSRVWTVTRHDLRQLLRSRDFLVPMSILGALFFIILPGALLLTIEAIGALGPIQQVSDALDVLPEQAQAQIQGDTPATGPSTRWRSTSSLRLRSSCP